jgi:hypothetical protein
MAWHTYGYRVDSCTDSVWRNAGGALAFPAAGAVQGGALTPLEVATTLRAIAADIEQSKLIHAFSMGSTYEIQEDRHNGVETVSIEITYRGKK